MPIVRYQIQSYVETWNIHDIRKQPRRPQSIPGKPYINYYHPNLQVYDTPDKVEDYCVPLDQDLLRTMQQDICDWDADEYLPDDILAWCRQQLTEIGFNPNDPPPRRDDELDQPYRTIYEDLRQRAIDHERSNELPIFRLCEKPLYAANWQPRFSE